MLDWYDRRILKLLINYRNSEISTNFIALRVGISPLTAKKHLHRLLINGYVLYRAEGKTRSYLNKKRKEINAPPKLMWRLRYRK